MIERVRFKNYKALQDVEIEFGRFTVLVGANACGKSSVLQGIDGLLGGLERGRDEIFKHAQDGAWGQPSLDWPRELASDCTSRQTIGSAGPVAIEISGGSHDGETAEFSFRATRGAYDPTLTTRRDTGDFSKIGAVALTEKVADETALSSRYLQFESQRLAEPAYSTMTPRLEPTGHGFTAYLADLALNNPRKLEAIRQELIKVVPGLGLFRFPRRSVERLEQETVVVDSRSFERSTRRAYPGNGLEVETEHSTHVGWLPAGDLSEGTLLTLGLLTAVHTSDANIIMFDDIDRGLHPRAQGDLIACLRRVLEKRPELQIICTTHSPFLLNHFEADEVRVMGLDENRHAHVRTLSDHPEWEKWKETMQVGEFWSVVGDDWAGQDG